ncbi:MAG: tRNA 2-thiouridine(34) synthase MnmA, partial [Thermoleophilia bacterium]|nr:tRNA 2-thiouridine(34) synthase MnmA [Thermoleophilia bacterium]
TLVGMSGGVDSSVAALLLRERGLTVAGVTLRLWSPSEDAGDKSCCSPAAVRRARLAAHNLGIPHFTVDAVSLFGESVVEYFVAEYAAGRTPNPCAKCNARLRFPLLRNLADRLGLAWVGTGHYARLTGEPPRLARGRDRRKDQSYVLAEVDPSLLERCVFPLGEMTKRQVRHLAAERGIVGYEAPESQEICFIPDNNYRRFLRTRLGDRPGLIVDTQGEMRGRHRGTYGF